MMLPVTNRVRASAAVPQRHVRSEPTKVIALWLGALLALWLGGVHAESLSGKVVNVADGDTLTVLVGERQVKVRLASIDAPESGQAFGTRSRQALAQLCHGREATVAEEGKDRYGRTIGTVTCAGTDANAAQVAAGMAWVYVQYAPKGSPLYGLQAEAQSARRGLWADLQPVAPWEWRAKAK